MTVSFARVTRSEWTKIVSVWSTWAVLAGTAVVTVACAAVIGALADTPQPGYAFLAVDVCSLVLGVLGVVVVVTGEYATGLIRVTLTAVPRRWPVPLGKAVVLASLTFPAMLAVSIASNIAFRLAAGSGERAPFAVVLGSAGALTGLGLFGLGIGLLVRHTAAAIAVYAGTTLVAPGLLPFLAPELIKYVPVAAAQAMYALDPGKVALLDRGAAALVLAGWVAITLGAGTIAMCQRDA